MAKKKKNLRPGKGAIAEVLPKFIKPQQPIPGNKKQKVLVVLTEEGFDENKRLIFRFHYKDGFPIETPFGLSLFLERIYIFNNNYETLYNNLYLFSSEQPIAFMHNRGSIFEDDLEARALYFLGGL